MALARPAVQTLAEGRIALAESDVTAAGQWPNPEFVYEREQINGGAADSTENSYWFFQRFEISGQRGLQKEAAQHRVQAATLGTQAERAQIEARTRARFYDLLHQQERIAAIEVWLRHMSAIESVIRKRETAGDVSGYDTLRLSRERSSAQAALQKEQARYRRLWAELASILGGTEVLGDYDSVTGQLLPDLPLPMSEVLETVGRRPDVMRLSREVAAHDLERRAGERGWVPELTLGVGRKTVDNDLGSDSGPQIAAGVSIPLFNRGESEQRRASANAAIARSQHQLALSAAEGEVRGLWQEVTDLTHAANAQHRGVREEAARLIEIAEAAYRGGELGILELLDAYRAAHDGAMQALEIAAAARRARIELDRLTGGSIQ